MRLNAWPIKSGTNRRCGLVGVGVALLWKCVIVQQALRSHICTSYAQCGTVHFLLLRDQDIELLATSLPRLPACGHTSTMIMD